MSKGLGRIEQAILAALRRRHQPLLADRWHPLLVRHFDEGTAAALWGIDEPAISGIARVRWAIEEAVFVKIGVEPLDAALPQRFWDGAMLAAESEIDFEDTEPHLGDSLTELVSMMRSSDKPHAVEVSVQRAAKRLADKSLIERRYITNGVAGKGIWPKERTFVSVRIATTSQELAEAAVLRAEARQAYLRLIREAVSWIRHRGDTLFLQEGLQPHDGYRQATIEWKEHEEKLHDDAKWLYWFENL